MANTTKENKKKSTTKNATVKKDGFFKSALLEIKKVRWPSKKEMVKYSIATICFVIFFALFFYGIELVVYFIKSNI